MATPTGNTTGPRSEEGQDQIINKWVHIVGELPQHQFDIEKYNKDGVVTFRGSAREKLRRAIKDAHLVYLTSDDRKRVATLKRLLTDIRRIETAAHGLRLLVEGNSPASDYAFGLRAIAGEEGQSILEAITQSLSRAERKSLGLTYDRFSGSTRLQMAIEGVQAIHRWAKAAADLNQRRIARLPTQKAAQGHVRHVGNVALNSYIEYVVEECWCGVWGRPISDGPKLWKFVVVAAAGIGVPLSEEASRGRIRRVFGLRGGGKSKGI